MCLFIKKQQRKKMWRDDMDEKTLKVLEFDKVIDMLEGCSASTLGKEHIVNLKPCCDFDIVNKWQGETTDGVDFILKLGLPNLGGIKDIRVAPDGTLVLMLNVAADDDISVAVIWKPSYP